MLAAMLLLGRISSAQTAGSLDTEFSMDGKHTVDYGYVDLYKDVNFKSNGKIAAAGTSYGEFWDSSIKVTQYNNDGTIDVNFGTEGTFSYTLNYETGVYAMALTPHDKILVAVITTGFAGGFAMLMFQLNEDGTLDSEFGTDGVRYHDLGTNDDIAYDMAIQDDCNILLAGTNTDQNYNNVPVVVRFNEDGSLDSEFGTNGVASITVTAIENEFNSVCVQSDGKILAAGHIAVTIGTYSLLVARFNDDGTTDNSYGDDGVLVMNINNQGEEFLDMVCTEDDDLILSGIMQSMDQFQFKAFAMKLDVHGNPVSTFGNNGFVQLGDTEEDTAYAMALQNDGKIILGGNTGQSIPFNSNFGIWRLNADGTPDDTFGENGKISTDFNELPDQIEAFSIQNDGKLIAVGKARSENGQFDMAIARYFTTDVVGITESFTSGDVSVYPNPAISGTDIQIRAENNKIEKIQLIDMKGNSVYNVELSPDKATQSFRVETQNLASGIYSLVLRFEGNSGYSKKIVVSD